MKQVVELKDLFIGKLDAKNESISNNQDKERFMRGFLLPENIQVDRFLNGTKYFNSIVEIYKAKS